MCHQEKMWKWEIGSDSWLFVVATRNSIGYEALPGRIKEE